MTFNYTDRHLNYFNGEVGVYSVNKEFADRKGRKIVTAKEDINPKNETNTITTSDGQKFQSYCYQIRS